MQTATLAQLKKEVQNLPYPQVVELCLRLAKYKKDNKELLHYLLFEAQDEQQFIAQVKLTMDEQFAEINTSHLYYAKKMIRKVLRGVTKHIKYSGQAQTAVELLIYFLQKLRELDKALYHSTQLMNLYEAQLKKINKELSKLHEDIQYDYQKELDALVN
ncbi:MAG: hypothetical protein EAY81_06540 [Bacteroidetes bacterium]|nr:MAG: hypothetical protein EAY81_06540 [Bacteroidota bacterium]